MRCITLIISTLILASCSSGQENAENTVSATSAASATQSIWKSSMKPFSVVVENSIDGLDRLGVKIISGEDTPEEKEAVDESGLIHVGSGVFKPITDKAQLSDTTTVMAVYYPESKQKITGTVIERSAPFNESLYGKEELRICNPSDSTLFESHVSLHSSMAVLEIKFSSVELRDILDRVVITGSGLQTYGKYDLCSGLWADTYVGGEIEAIIHPCLLNNGVTHNIYLIPNVDEMPIRLTATVNGKEYSVNTTLSPMAPGCLIRLNLFKSQDKLSITGSWINQKRKLVAKEIETYVIAEPGNYLRADGRITVVRDSTCIAEVISTDGVHGTAVGLFDLEGQYIYSKKSSVAARLYETVDGKRSQGRINPLKKDATPDTYILIYTSESKFNETCAFADPDGVDASTSLYRQQLADGEKGTDQYSPVGQVLIQHPGAYLPSLREMAELYLKYNPVKGEPKELTIAPLEGLYLTSTEQTVNTTYTFDFTQGAVGCNNPKSYGSGKVRLFYIF